MKKIVASLALVLALLAGGSAFAASSGPAHESRAAGVNIDHFKFHPGKLVVGKGAKVVFANSASIAHTATDRGVFDTGHIKPGHSVAVRFERRGTFAYHCEIHPFMHGKIVVR